MFYSNNEVNDINKRLESYEKILKDILVRLDSNETKEKVVKKRKKKNSEDEDYKYDLSFSGLNIVLPLKSDKGG